MREKRNFTTEFKKSVAESAIALKENGMKNKQIETITGVDRDQINRWTREYKSGYFDEKTEPTKKLKALREIDIRPELKSIPKAIDKLSSMVERACIRLDAIYVELTERKGLSEIEETEPLELDDDDFIDGLKKQNGVD